MNVAPICASRAFLVLSAVMFAVRIVTADYYIANPIRDLDVCYSEFRENDVKKVPVVRIFGATPAGNPDRFGSFNSDYGHAAAWYSKVLPRGVV